MKQKPEAMKKFYRLVTTHESFVVSRLRPQDFGNYLAVGTRKQIHGQVIFFEFDPRKIKTPQDDMSMKMEPYDDREPKRSVYISIYRCVEIERIGQQSGRAIK